KVGDNFQKHSYPLGLIVNLKGQRFVDEGADFRNYTYVKYGRAVIGQPRRTAFQIFDQKVLHNLREEYRIREVTKAEDMTLEGLARKLEIDVDGFVATIRAYNASLKSGDYNPAVKDGKATHGITPPKSNWALPLDTPPYVGFAVTTGITFTFGGLKITADGQVIDCEQRPIPGLFAAGELVGGLFYHNYPGGAGFMAGGGFGGGAGGAGGGGGRGGCCGGAAVGAVRGGPRRLRRAGRAPRGRKTSASRRPWRRRRRTSRTRSARSSLEARPGSTLPAPSPGGRVLGGP